MTADDLTPAEKDAVQIYYLKRWLAARQQPGRRMIRHWRATPDGRPKWPKWQPWGTHRSLKPLSERIPDGIRYPG